MCYLRTISLVSYICVVTINYLILTLHHILPSNEVENLLLRPWYPTSA